ncbi:hypothetical protein E2C01_040248 [Portunus trituberculatus]|uniref:Uncharacterized protein n=1 Tax=Portunus trituberculatus TaxID=210409 RepID=A0A5B7FNN9_PORTR|nr:hypothetical protein [Portunus trituberculatus]
MLSRARWISGAASGVSVKKGAVGRDGGKGAVSARYLEHNRCKTVRYVAEVPWPGRQRTYYKDSSQLSSRSDNHAFPGTPFKPRLKNHFRVDTL